MPIQLFGRMGVDGYGPIYRKDVSIARYRRIYRLDVSIAWNESRLGGAGRDLVGMSLVDRLERLLKPSKPLCRASLV